MLAHAIAGTGTRRAERSFPLTPESSFDSVCRITTERDHVIIASSASSTRSLQNLKISLESAAAGGPSSPAQGYSKKVLEQAISIYRDREQLSELMEPEAIRLAVELVASERIRSIVGQMLADGVRDNLVKEMFRNLDRQVAF